MASGRERIRRYIGLANDQVARLSAVCLIEASFADLEASTRGIPVPFRTLISVIFTLTDGEKDR